MNSSELPCRSSGWTYGSRQAAMPNEAARSRVTVFELYPRLTLSESMAPRRFKWNAEVCSRGSVGRDPALHSMPSDRGLWPTMGM